MEGVRKFVPWIMSKHPDAHGEIKRVFADGDYVILHSHWHGLSDNPRGKAVVDIFRLEDGKLAEHWGCHSAGSGKGSEQQHDVLTARAMTSAGAAGVKRNTKLTATDPH